MRRLKSRAAAAILGAAALAAGISGSPAQASGATWNYIVMPTWLGNCPNGGSVKTVFASSWSASTTGYASDSGDDIVYLRVGYNESVQIVGNVQCVKTVSGRPVLYNGPAVSVWIYPTRANQAWWIGPGGVSHN